jgi:hypothetical protein
MTQDVSTPDDDSNPNAVPQAAAGPVESTQSIVGTIDGTVSTEQVASAPPTLADQIVDEGLALLKTAAQAVESEGRKIVALAEHAIVPVGVGPRTVEAARDLPFAAPGETLFEAGEHLLFRAFRDVGDEVRHIYLNEFGNHVKA